MGLNYNKNLELGFKTKRMGNWKGWSQSPDEISFKYNKLKQNKKIKNNSKSKGKKGFFSRK